MLFTALTSPWPNRLGYARIPGLFNAAPMQSWQRMRYAVHVKGGKGCTDYPALGA